MEAVVVDPEVANIRDEEYSLPIHVAIQFAAPIAVRN
jgi:hypothetical protein